MKAVNRLDYGIELRRKLQFDLITVTKYLNLEEKADALYSQPFKPEMITELFEGVVKGENDDWFMNGYCFFYRFNQCEWKYWNNKSCHLWVDNILTLNDFISDCQRAGIELTFKKEIEDKLC